MILDGLHKDVKASCGLPVWGYYPGLHLGQFRKTTRNLRHETW